MISAGRFFGFCVLTVCASTAWANRYSITDLGPGERPTAVNRAGVVASNFIGHTNRGEVFRAGQWRALPPHSQVYDIDRSGTAVGTDYELHTAMAWPHNGPAVTLPLPGDARFGTAWGINDNETVVGGYITADGSSGCFEWSSTRGAADFGNGAYWCSASQINNVGQVTGEFAVEQGSLNHAFLWNQGNFVDLSVLPGTLLSEGIALNDVGQVVGISYNSTDTLKGFIWDGSLVDLDPNHKYYSVSPLSVNNSGNAVGWIEGSAGGGKAAVRFAHGEILRLEREVINSDGWQLNAATSINDKGIIVGYGKYHGTARAFMLTPE